MPEGDTVFLAATRLNRALAGERLLDTDFRVPAHATTKLTGRTVNEVVARGKHLLFRIEGGVTLHTHFKMEGSWHLYRRGEGWRGPGHQIRAVLTTKPWVAVGFRLATTELLPTADEEEVVGHLGPDLLGPEWDADRALENLRRDPTRPLGDALVDQRVMAGLGNVYRCEIAFLRGIVPWAPLERAGDLEAVVALAHRLMRANRTTGRQVTTGDLGPGRGQWVYGRAGQPCRRCGTLVARSAGPPPERVTFWCPTCQPEP